VDVPDLALRLGDGRPGLRAALPTDLAVVTRVRGSRCWVVQGSGGRVGGLIEPGTRNPEP
jgi:hypothetical protein